MCFVLVYFSTTLSLTLSRVKQVLFTFALYLLVCWVTLYILDNKGLQQVLNVVHTTRNLKGSKFVVHVYHLGGSVYNIHLNGANLVFSTDELAEFEFGTNPPMWFGVSTGSAG